jgi:NADPH2:quinone reductase
LIDQLSGIFASANLNITKVGGRIINVGRLSGQQSKFDFNKHAERRITYIGTTGRTRNIHEHEQVAQSAYDDLWNAISTNDLQMPIDCVFGFKDVDKALQRMAENQHLGRIMLEFKQE